MIKQFFLAIYTFLSQYHVQQCFDLFGVLFALYVALTASTPAVAGMFAFFSIMSGVFIYFRQISHQAS